MSMHSNMRLEVERLVWAAGVIHCLHSVALDSLVPFLTFFHLCLVSIRGSDDSRLPWRQTARADVNGDCRGLFMSIALLPCILLKHAGDNEGEFSSTKEYSIAVAIYALLEWNSCLTIGKVATCSCVSLFLCHGDIPVSGQPNWYLLGLFTGIWCLMGRVILYPLRPSFTQGEFFCVRGLATLAVTEFLQQSSHTVIFAHTAIAGVTGCFLSCGLVGYIMPANDTNALWKLCFIAIATLGTVETLFWVRGIDGYTFPRCLSWIFLDFMVETEPMDGDGWSLLSEWPRMAWLGYWGVIMVFTIPFAPGSNVNPILARKWFHFVASLLFVPSTILAPQMQSLSYAVALCVLMILETTRRHVPLLNTFYKTYLDRSKQESDGEIIISHMALIVGCATPLWLWQWQGSPADKRHVALWGVWVLGVGDSMAALLGKRFGRHRWGDNKRTIEGSLAMALGLAMVTYQQASVGMCLTIALSTLLEAFTLQIDNIVLPVVGYVILMAG